MEVTSNYRGRGRTVAEPQVLAELIDRLERVGPGAIGAWGRMSSHQMLIHLAVNHDAVLGRSAWTTPSRTPSRFVKFLALRLPMQWMRNLKFGDDPAGSPADPATFAADRARAVTTLADLAHAGPDAFSSPHPIFGQLSRGEWQRWAFLHTDHHLRQFGL